LKAGAVATFAISGGHAMHHASPLPLCRSCSLRPPLHRRRLPRDHQRWYLSRGRGAWGDAGQFVQGNDECQRHRDPLTFPANHVSGNYGVSATATGLTGRPSPSRRRTNNGPVARSLGDRIRLHH
jgi:hypothetical protein